MHRPQRPAAVVAFLQFRQKLFQIPFQRAVFVIDRIGDVDFAVVQQFCKEDEVPVLRQGSASHERDQDVAGGEKLRRMFEGPVRDAFRLQAVGRKRVGDQAVVGTAVKGVVSVVGSPCGDVRGIDGGVAEAVDDHGRRRGAASVGAHGVVSSVEVIAPSDITLMIVEHRSAGGVQHVQIDLVRGIVVFRLQAGDVAGFSGGFDIRYGFVYCIRRLISVCRGRQAGRFRQRERRFRKGRKLPGDTVPGGVRAVQDGFDGKGPVQEEQADSQREDAGGNPCNQQSGQESPLFLFRSSVCFHGIAPY